MGTLYIVATPIGNLDDITFRAVDVLKKVQLIACEDTRVTAKLSERYAITTQRTAIHHHSKEEKLLQIIDVLKNGKDVAYVSDAGTPGISDPGNHLVRVALDNGICVVPVPGPSALTTILSVAGFDTQQFLFLAYPPHKKGRKTFFERIVHADVPVVYYDSVHRVLKNLTLLAEMQPATQIVLGRELTKVFEEIHRGSTKEIIDYFERNPEKMKGEFVIVVEK